MDEATGKEKKNNISLVFFTHSQKHQWQTRDGSHGPGLRRGDRSNKQVRLRGSTIVRERLRTDSF